MKLIKHKEKNLSTRLISYPKLKLTHYPGFYAEISRGRHHYFLREKQQALTSGEKAPTYGPILIYLIKYQCYLAKRLDKSRRHFIIAV